MKIKFLNTNEEFEMTEGKTVLDMANECSFEMPQDCGGNCSCSTCHVLIEQGMEFLTEISETEEMYVEEADDYEESKSRLSCQACLKANSDGEIVVRVPI